MKLSIKIATLGVLSLLTIGCGEVTTSDNSEPIVSSHNETLRTESQTLEGKELFQPCKGCHGENGEVSALQKSAIIGGEDKNGLLYQLREYKAMRLNQYGLGGVMTGQVKNLSDNELIVLSEYISKLTGYSNTNETTTPSTPTSSNVSGKEIYAKCAGCHGANGEKLALGKSKRIAGVNKEVLLYQLEQYKNGDLDQYGMGQLMKGQVAGLSHRELELVSEYVSKL